MACYRPLPAYKTAAGDVSFDRRQGDTELTLPCGACVGCRIARARAWSLRCVHEASLHKLNCFVTLTYSEDRLPPGGSLRYRDFQLFMKRLRKASQMRVRFFVCGEYGEALSRPHYHACLFGYDFPDKKPVSYLAQTQKAWRSALLERLWTHGHTHLGSLNVRSAGYAARYVLKKVTGLAGELHYRRVDLDGAVHDLVPEFARMSLRPGIASAWFSKFRSDVTTFDYVVHEGKKYPVPKYYDRLLDRDDPDLLARWKEDRELRALPFRPDGSPDRLVVRETVEAARIKTLTRNLES
nr:MAG: replication initiator protein [Microvirus sp.]